MQDAIIVRRATAGDAEVIAEFNRAMARETEDVTLNADVVKRGVSAVLSDANKGCYYLAQVGSGAAGQIMITYEWSDWRNGWFWWIQSVYVRPEQRKQGVFRALFEHVRDAARKESNVCGLRLYVHRDNRKAKATYAALGMHETEYDAVFELEFPRQG